MLRLGHRIDDGRIHTQCLADLAQGATRPVAVHGGRQRGAAAAVLAVDVLDHFFAALVLEVHVDVGWFFTFFADEAGKQQPGRSGIDLGHAQAVAHRRVGRRAAPLAQDAARTGKLDQVVDRQEISFIFLLGDQGQFHLDLGAHLARYPLRIAFKGPGQGFLAQIVGRAHAQRHQFVRIFISQFSQAELATGRHRQGLGQGRRAVHQRQPHAWPQVLFGIGGQGQAAFLHRLADADGRDHILQVFARTLVHLHVAHRRQRQAVQPCCGIDGSAVQVVQRTVQARHADP